MKNIYRIYDHRDRYLCNQVAPDEERAIQFAKMYGYHAAARASFVRKD